MKDPHKAARDAFRRAVWGADLAPLQKLIAVAICEHWIPGQHLALTQRELCRLTGIAKPMTLRPHLDVLRERGFIDVRAVSDGTVTVMGNHQSGYCYAAVPQTSGTILDCVNDDAPQNGTTKMDHGSPSVPQNGTTKMDHQEGGTVDATCVGDPYSSSSKEEEGGERRHEESPPTVAPPPPPSSDKEVDSPSREEGEVTDFERRVAEMLARFNKDVPAQSYLRMKCDELLVLAEGDEDVAMEVVRGKCDQFYEDEGKSGPVVLRYATVDFAEKVTRAKVVVQRARRLAKRAERDEQPSEPENALPARPGRSEVFPERASDPVFIELLVSNPTPVAMRKYEEILAERAASAERGAA